MTAKDICEHVLCDVLARNGKLTVRKHELGNLLKHLLEILQNRGRNRRTFHSSSTFPLSEDPAAARPHSHRPVVAHGPITLELALSVSTDLIEVLSAAG
jgi:hypothetical protein